MQVQYSGIGIFGLLGVLFVGLKLSGHIDWSWWFVLMPFYLGWAILFGFVALMFVIVSVVGGLVWLFDRGRK